MGETDDLGAADIRRPRLAMATNEDCCADCRCCCNCDNLPDQGPDCG